MNSKCRSLGLPLVPLGKLRHVDEGWRYSSLMLLSTYIVFVHRHELRYASRQTSFQQRHRAAMPKATVFLPPFAFPNCDSRRGSTKGTWQSLEQHGPSSSLVSGAASSADLLIGITTCLRFRSLSLLVGRSVYYADSLYFYRTCETSPTTESGRVVDVPRAQCGEERMSVDSFAMPSRGRNHLQYCISLFKSIGSNEW